VVFVKVMSGSVRSWVVYSPPVGSPPGRRGCALFTPSLCADTSPHSSGDG
jgi:hypothetical protein